MAFLHIYAKKKKKLCCSDLKALFWSIFLNYSVFLVKVSSGSKCRLAELVNIWLERDCLPEVELGIGY